MKNDNYIPALSFDFLTRYYDRVIKTVMPGGFREKLLRHIQLTPNQKILDFGTGTAELAILIKKTAPSAIVTGIDVDPKVLNIARQKIRNENLDIQLLTYNGDKFPFPGNYFHIVVSCLVFHHLSPEQKRNALDEIFRVMSTGSKLYIADWGLERNKIKAKLLNVFKYVRVLKHITEQGKGALPGYIINAGFRHVTETSYIKTISGTLCYYEAEKIQ